MKIRTLIIDDMRFARDRMQRFLIADGEIEIVGECNSGRGAIAAIEDLKPELVFLDVQMPEMGGFEVIEAIGAENMPALVFVPTFDHFALRIFETVGLNYTLKPFDTARFWIALKRAKLSLNKNVNRDAENQFLNLLEQLKNQPKYLKRMPIKKSGQTIFLPINEIDRIESAGNQMQIYAGKSNI